MHSLPKNNKTRPSLPSSTGINFVARSSPRHLQKGRLSGNFLRTIYHSGQSLTICTESQSLFKVIECLPPVIRHPRSPLKARLGRKPLLWVSGHPGIPKNEPCRCQNISYSPQRPLWTTFLRICIADPIPVNERTTELSHTWYRKQKCVAQRGVKNVGNRVGEGLTWSLITNMLPS